MPAAQKPHRKFFGCSEWRFSGEMHCHRLTESSFFEVRFCEDHFNGLLFLAEAKIIIIRTPLALSPPSTWRETASHFSSLWAPLFGLTLTVKKKYKWLRFRLRQFLSNWSGPPPSGLSSPSIPELLDGFPMDIICHDCPWCAYWYKGANYIWLPLRSRCFQGRGNASVLVETTVVCTFFLNLGVTPKKEPRVKNVWDNFSPIGPVFHQNFSV